MSANTLLAIAKTISRAVFTFTGLITQLSKFNFKLRLLLLERNALFTRAHAHFHCKMIYWLVTNGFKDGTRTYVIGRNREAETPVSVLV